MRIIDWSSDVCSSDLSANRAGLDHQPAIEGGAGRGGCRLDRCLREKLRRRTRSDQADQFRNFLQRARRGAGKSQPRSEEHTSELQSLMRISYAVFCLKKKKNIQNNMNDRQEITIRRNYPSK